MNTPAPSPQGLHPLFQQIVCAHGAPAPRELTQQECQAIDAAMHADKLADGYSKRHEARALSLQMRQPQTTEGFFI